MSQLLLTSAKHKTRGDAARSLPPPPTPRIFLPAASRLRWDSPGSVAGRSCTRTTRRHGASVVDTETMVVGDALARKLHV